MKCIQSILRSSFKNFEIIVVEQEGNGYLKTELKKFKARVRYFNLMRKGASRAKNYGISQSRSKILAFTDDDCVVHKNWLQNIYVSFIRHKDAVGVFGAVKPYKPDNHRGMTCLSVFTASYPKLLKRPVYHARFIGFGNNMAYRKEVFEKLGGFKTWLGPSSVAKSAEDGEYALRVLVAGLKLLYEPSVVVWHKNWLSSDRYREKMLSYILGEFACYGYYFFKGQIFAKKVIVQNASKVFGRFSRSFNELFKLKINRGTLGNVFFEIREVFAIATGLTLGLYYSFKENWS